MMSVGWISDPSRTSVEYLAPCASSDRRPVGGEHERHDREFVDRLIGQIVRLVQEHRRTARLGQHDRVVEMDRRIGCLHDERVLVRGRSQQQPDQREHNGHHRRPSSPPTVARRVGRYGSTHPLLEHAW
jgi:hypothetical protein